MQHDHVPKKLNFDPHPQDLRSVILLSYCCIRDSLFKFDMYHDLKKINFDLLTPRVSGGGVMRAKNCSNCAAFVIPFNFICNMTTF